MSDRFEGYAREAGGSAQEFVGDTIGDAALQARGIGNQMAGRVQQAVGQADETVSQLRETIRSQPLIAAAVAAGIGYLIGRLSA